MIDIELFEKLKAFIIRESFVNNIEITPETIIETEFGITGDDAFDFILAFSNEFSVDITNFDISSCFKGEGDKVLIKLLAPHKIQKPYLKLTVGDLFKAIVLGKLDHTVIKG